MMNMRKKLNNGTKEIVVIGVDHGYGNIKTTHTCFQTGVTRYEKEPTFQGNLLIYGGHYYQIGEEHKEFLAEKMLDEDYYILTLAAIGRELHIRGLTEAAVYLAAGLPLTWVSEQKEAFREYLLQKEAVEFQFKGVNMLADIGNGTMNVMYINECKPLEKKCFTEKYGTNQCIFAVRGQLLRQFGTTVDDGLIERVLRHGTADISERYLRVIRETATQYVQEIFRKLREHEYNPELMKLYVVGGGRCLMENFYPKQERIIINKDICATAKGYELRWL